MSEVIERPYWPQHVYVNDAARDDAMTKRVLSRLPADTKVKFVSSTKDPAASEPELARVGIGKRTLMLSRFLGEWLEHCPAGTSSHVCCNLMTVSPGEGCPLDCTYCYLQSYLKRNPTNKIFTNVSDMLSAVEERISKDPQRLFRVGTGEVVDSLVWDDLTDLSQEMVPFFGRQQNALLEFRTKTNIVDNLIEMRDVHNGNTVVSWSVNAKSICDKDELNTAPLEARFEAAARCVDAGYRVGFHFDPIVYFEGCEDEYRDTVRALFKAVDKESIAWVSLGTLRYKREMHDTMRQRFPDSTIPYGEQRFSPDKKLRYPQPLRMHLQRVVWDELKRFSPSIPLYMCMENSAAWRSISGMMPGVDSNLIEIASRKGKQGLEASSKIVA